MPMDSSLGPKQNRSHDAVPLISRFCMIVQASVDLHVKDCWWQCQTFWEAVRVMMTSARLGKTSVTPTNRPFQDHTHPDPDCQRKPTYDATPVFKPFTKLYLCDTYTSIINFTTGKFLTNASDGDKNVNCWKYNIFTELTLVPPTIRNIFTNNYTLTYELNSGGVVVSALDFRSEVQWFDA